MRALDSCDINLVIGQDAGNRPSSLYTTLGESRNDAGRRDGVEEEEETLQRDQGCYEANVKWKQGNPLRLER